MSLFKVKTVSGVRLDLNANHVVSIAERDDGKAQVLVSTGIVYELDDTARSVRGYVRKALAAQTVVDSGE